MSTTITLDKFGRFVVPKGIRDSLELQEGSRLKLEVRAGKIEMEPETNPKPWLALRRSARFLGNPFEPTVSESEIEYLK
jgi:AbrB family looped-hinge helix DNA binding protein